MLHIGGAHMFSFTLLPQLPVPMPPLLLPPSRSPPPLPPPRTAPPLPPPRTPPPRHRPPKSSPTPPQRTFLVTTSGPSVTTNDRMTSADDAKLTTATTSIFHQSTTGHSSTSDQFPPPPWMSEQRGYIVGPMIYVYFSAANASRAGFTVDLLFQHPSYLKVKSLFHLILFSSCDVAW